MDLMSKAVDEMRLRGAEYRRETFRAPWSEHVPAGTHGAYCVLEGRAALHLDGASFPLAAGDFVLVTRGSEHHLEAVAQAPNGASGAMLHGQLEFEAPDHPLFNVLPPVIHASADRQRDNPRYRRYLDSLIDEICAARDGFHALATRLTEIILIETLRFFTPPPGVECPVGGWFSGLADPGIRRALAAIHEDPSKQWTVATLAKIARESRSTFAAHFASVMREPPMAYLTRWRMFQSRALLRRTKLSLDAIAEKVGYGSAAAFSLAFTRSQGMSPGSYRRSNAVESEASGRRRA